MFLSCLLLPFRSLLLPSPPEDCLLLAPGQSIDPRHLTPLRFFLTTEGSSLAAAVLPLIAFTSVVCALRRLSAAQPRILLAPVAPQGLL
jgi:hypothetical protein